MLGSVANFITAIVKIVVMVALVIIFGPLVLRLLTGATNTPQATSVQAEPVAYYAGKKSVAAIDLKIEAERLTRLAASFEANAAAFDKAATDPRNAQERTLLILQGERERRAAAGAKEDAQELNETAELVAAGELKPFQRKEMAWSNWTTARVFLLCLWLLGGAVTLWFFWFNPNSPVIRKQAELSGTFSLRAIEVARREVESNEALRELREARSSDGNSLMTQMANATRLTTADEAAKVITAEQQKALGLLNTLGLVVYVLVAWMILPMPAVYSIADRTTQLAGAAAFGVANGTTKAADNAGLLPPGLAESAPGLAKSMGTNAIQAADAISAKAGEAIGDVVGSGSGPEVRPNTELQNGVSSRVQDFINRSRGKVPNPQ